jgi:hypothetical protein
MSPTIADAWAQLLAHPWQHVIAHWNWKAAVLSGLIRGSIFFMANLPAGWPAALLALAVDLSFRLPLVGLYAALVQVFVNVEPVWAATAVVMVGVPCLSHTIEFTAHCLAGTPALKASVAASIALSVVSSGFELFAMRRGVFIVGPAAASLSHDLRRLPRVVGEFVWAIVAGMRRLVRGQTASLEKHR